MIQQDTNSAIQPKYSGDTSVNPDRYSGSVRKSLAGSVNIVKKTTDSAATLESTTLPKKKGVPVSLPDSLSMTPGSLQEFRFSDIDTIRLQSNDVPILQGPRLFSGHVLEPLHKSPQTYNKPNPDWFTVILFVILFGFMWIWVFYQKILKQLVNAFFSSSVANQIVRDENILIQRASVMLSILFYLEFALFLFQVSMDQDWQNRLLTDGFSRMIIFAFFIAFAYSMKMILLKLLGYLLDVDKYIASYIFNIFLMNNILGMVLMPAVIIIAYVSTPFTHYILNGAMMLIGITFLYRLVRGFFIGLTIPKFSIFYLFLYLCTFEIAPLAIIFKIAYG